MPGSQMLRTYGDKPEPEDGNVVSITNKDSTTSQEDQGRDMSPCQGKVRVILTMFSIYLGVFIAALDTVSLPTALPTITVALKASDTGFAWIGATHMLSGATSIALWSKISDVFGRKSVLLAAKALFMVGSLVSALCTGIGMLFVGRVLQGMGGAGVVILANRLIDDIFDSHHRGFYLMLSGIVWSLAMAIAPAFGGAFAEHVGWRWCFWINLPCIFITFTILYLLLRVDHPRTPVGAGIKTIDWLGTFAIISGTILFLLGVEMGGVRFAWNSPAIIGLIILGIVLFIVFLFIEWKVAPQPLFPLRTFRVISASASFLICATHGMSYQAHLYFIPSYFQAVLSLSPTKSGLLSLIMTGTMALTNVFTGLYLKKHRNHHAMVIRSGAALITLGLGLFINFPPHLSYPRLIFFQILLALGLGLLFQAPLLHLQNSLPAASIGPATASFVFLRPLSYGISAVVGQLLLQSQLKTKYAEMIRAEIPEWIASTLAFEDTVKGTPLIVRLNAEQQHVVRSAIANGLDRVWIFYTAVALVGIAAALCMGDRKTEEDEEEKREA